MGVSRGECRLHIHGDGTPGAAVRIRVDDLEALHAEVGAKNHKCYRPGRQDQEWGTREMTVQDGSGNKLIFHRDLPRPHAVARRRRFATAKHAIAPPSSAIPATARSTSTDFPAEPSPGNSTALSGSFGS